MRGNLKSFQHAAQERPPRKIVVVTSTFPTIKQSKEKPMNKDRIEGSVEQAKGKAKEVAGKATGDTKLEAEGKAQKAAGKVQNTVGGIKDSVKEATE
jgi:uncharacterized protein YjbJ (UPF0337 family)